MNRGFTLIETVIMIAISVIAFTALANLFFIFNTLYGYEKAFTASAGSASAVMNAIEAAVLPSDAVLASHSFSGTTYASDSDTLVLSLPSIDAEGDLVEGVRDYVAFYASSTELYRRVEADAASTRPSGTTLLSTSLDSLSFTYDSAVFAEVTNVIVDIRTRGTFKNETVESTLREQLYLRNVLP